MISQQIHVEIQMMRSVLRGELRPDPLRGIRRLTMGRVWEAGWRPLAGVEDCVQRREREKERERGGGGGRGQFSLILLVRH